MVPAPTPKLEARRNAVFDKLGPRLWLSWAKHRRDRFFVVHNGGGQADLPLKALSGNAPEYDRPT